VRLSPRPTKALESNPYLEWDYELALKLGKTRAELVEGRPMPLSGLERATWIAFFKRRNQRRGAAIEDMRSED
jgi:hypothetical protein